MDDEKIEPHASLRHSDDPRVKPSPRQWLFYGSCAVVALLLLSAILLALGLLKTSGQESATGQGEEVPLPSELKFPSTTAPRKTSKVPSPEAEPEMTMIPEAETEAATVSEMETMTAMISEEGTGTAAASVVENMTAMVSEEKIGTVTASEVEDMTAVVSKEERGTVTALEEETGTATESLPYTMTMAATVSPSDPGAVFINLGMTSVVEESSTTASTMPPKSSPPTDHYPLLCTVSHKFGTQSKVPPDGLCDLLFYDSLYRDGRNKLGGPYDEGVKRFLALPDMMNSTGIGVSLDVQDRSFMDILQRSPDVLEAEAILGIDDLWNDGVSHFGILSIRESANLDVHMVTAYTRVLQRIFGRVQSKMSPNRTSYTVIGVRSSSCPTSGCMFNTNIQQITDIFKPSLYVAVSHVLFKDWQTRPCHIVPQTMLEFPGSVNRSDIIEQMSIMDVMYNLVWAVSNISVPMAISFTMQARLYKPAKPGDGPPAYQAYQKCQNVTGDSDAPPATLCGGDFDKEFRPLSPEAAVMTYDVAQERSATFETDETLKEKVCKARAAYPGIPFGIAVYDVDYDVAASACPLQHIRAGDFTRVETLKMLRDLVRDGFVDASSVADCMRVS